MDLERGRLSTERLFEIAGVLLVALGCWGVVSILRWLEGRTVHYLVAQILLLSAHLAVVVGLLWILMRSGYRWARGRSIFD